MATTEGDLQRIELELRAQIYLYGDSEENLIIMGETLQNRNFEPEDAALLLPETQTLALSAICFQKAFIMNQENPNYPLMLAKIYENWADLYDGESQQERKKLYQLALSNYALYFVTKRDVFSRAHIASIIKKFDAGLYHKFFDTTRSCLVWLFVSIFGKTINIHRVRTKLSNKPSEEYLWRFLKNFDQHDDVMILDVVSRINADG
jgi:hypothetical protein